VFGGWIGLCTEVIVGMICYARGDDVVSSGLGKIKYSKIT